MHTGTVVSLQSYHTSNYRRLGLKQLGGFELDAGRGSMVGKISPTYVGRSAVMQPCGTSVAAALNHNVVLSYYQQELGLL